MYIVSNYRCTLRLYMQALLVHQLVPLLSLMKVLSRCVGAITCVNLRAEEELFVPPVVPLL